MCTLKMSETRDKIFSALTKMQAELTNATKNKSGYGYKYADLAECIETAKEPLANNGLAVTQLLGMNSNNEATLITMLTHESGEYIGSEFIMEKTILNQKGGKNPAQEMGASITYMRRYAFAAIIGMAQEDNDADKPPQSKQQAPNPTPEELRNKLIKTLTTDFDNNQAKVWEYIKTALQRDVTGLADITVQDVAVIREYYSKNKPQSGGF